MPTIELDIEGMHCGGCVQRVTKAIAKLPGVTAEKVEVGKAYVRLEAGQESAVVDALNRLGFAARIAKGG
jgi:copper chaperone CopZ